MPRKKRLLLRIACFSLITFCALLLLQSAGIVPPLRVGWGDGVRARGYLAGFDGGIIFRTATGMKTTTGGGYSAPGGYAFGVYLKGEFDFAGSHYRHWNMILQKPDRTPLPGDLGTFVDVRIGLGVMLLLLLAAVLSCLWLLAKECRRCLAGREHLCRKCGYDLRATPDRCPECGLVPATPTAASQ